MAKPTRTKMVAAAGVVIDAEATILFIAFCAGKNATATLSYDSNYQAAAIQFNNTDLNVALAIGFPVNIPVKAGTTLYCNSGDGCYATILYE